MPAPAMSAPVSARCFCRVIFGTDYHSAFLWLGVIALVIAAWYLVRGNAAKTAERRDAARRGSDMRGAVFVWTRYIAIALMLAYAMSFGLEIAMNAWLPGYFTRGFHPELLALGFTSVAGVQIAAGTFAAVESFNASLFRPFAGFMSDLFQRKGWTPLPFIAKELSYAPRLHWLGIALILITLAMIGLTVAGVYGSLHWSVAVLVAFGIFLSFGTGGTFALVPLLFPDRPGIAAGFIGGVSTAGGIVYPLIFAGSATSTWDIFTWRSTCSCRSCCSISGRRATSDIPRSMDCSAKASPGRAPELRHRRCEIKIRSCDMNPVEIRVTPNEPWYKYGIACLLLEMVIAISVSAYSLYMTFNGLGGFPGKH